MYRTKALERFNELKQCEGYTVDREGNMIRIEKHKPQVVAAQKSLNKATKSV